jgi:predicted ATP-dependent protease
MGEMYSLISTAGVEPEPIPLDVKIIIIGNPFVYYTLQNVDEEFSELFKVKADFNTYMDRNRDNTNLYARFLAARCNEKGWSHFDKSGIARMVEFGSEMIGDQTKLSTRFADICDLASEADFWAKRNGNSTIGRSDVQKAIDSRRRRSNRIEERIQEMIEKEEIFIDR